MYLKKLTIGLILTAMMAEQIAVVPLAAAQTTVIDASGTRRVESCANGGKAYDAFVSSVISYDGFVEYWRDIFERYNGNMCVYFDIDSLLNRINKAREQIRQAFYTCDPNVTRLTQTYYELEGELFFLRKYVGFTGDGHVLFRSEKDVKNQFIQYLVYDKGFMGYDDAVKLFDRVLKKYKAREDAYINCKDPTWENLIQKWNEFKAHVGGLSSAKEAVETIRKRFDDATRAPKRSGGNLIQSLLDIKINGLDPETSLNDIGNELKKNMPGGVSYENIQSASRKENYRYTEELSRTTYLAQYQQQYSEGSGEVVGKLLLLLNDLQTTIINTFPYIMQTTKCTKGLLDKTCA